MLNIYTKALKYVEKNGRINIKVKIINEKKDLSYPEEFASQFEKNKKYGLL